MRYPLDGNELALADRSSVESDRCPTYRGLCQDRGELDKMVDRSSADVGRACTSAPRRPETQRDDHRDHGADDRFYRKRESFLSGLFDC